MSKEFIFKKNIFGGFDRQQVIEYLSHIQAECTDHSNAEKITVVNSQITNLLERIEEKKQKIESLKSELKKINELEQSHDTNIFKNIETADKIISTAREEAANQIKEANKNASQSSKEITNLLLRIDSLKSEIALIGSKADNISTNLNKFEFENESAVDYITYESEEENTADETLQAESVSCSENIIFDEASAFNEETSTENSIDNFFAELEKLTGSEEFYDNGPDLDEAFDKPQKKVHDTSQKKDTAFDDMLKSIFHES